MTLRVYSKPGCPNCDDLKELLGRLGLVYEDRDIEQYRVEHTGWREDGSVELSAHLNLMLGEKGGADIPIVEVDGEFFKAEAAELAVAFAFNSVYNLWKHGIPARVAAKWFNTFTKGEYHLNPKRMAAVVANQLYCPCCTGTPVECLSPDCEAYIKEHGQCKCRAIYNEQFAKDSRPA